MTEHEKGTEGQPSLAGSEGDGAEQGQGVFSPRFHDENAAHRGLHE